MSPVDSTAAQLWFSQFCGRRQRLFIHKCPLEVFQFYLVFYILFPFLKEIAVKKKKKAMTKTSIAPSRIVHA